MRVAREVVKLEPGSVLWLSGPVRVRIVEGGVVAGGVRVGEGFEFLVQAERGASIYAIDESATVELVVGAGGSYRVEKGGEAVGLAREWLRVAEGVAEIGAKLVAVLAPVESGKSTLSLWLANRLGGCYASLDAGQNELGTPGYFSATPIEHVALSPRDLGAKWAWLVGCNAPEHCHWPAMAAAASLARFTRSACKAVVLDTDGFVDSAGLVYKASLLEVLRPDAAIVIRKGPWMKLQQIARIYSDTVLEAPPVPPSLVRSRSRAERRAYRERMYRMLFQNAERVTLSLEDVVLLNSEVAGFPQLPVQEDAYLAPDGTLRLAQRQQLQGLLSSIVLQEGYEVPALLEHLSVRSKSVTLRVAWKPEGKPVAVKLGFTRLVGWREERLPLRPHAA
ncbi:GTPase or GTP-binding - cren protein [Pyrolobus fumarii 1A]|uniref:polynucleotide 5'-hydroxyl-kinase n=1 Tax=Pyrolobus fumarii (strain DSM 11204 / 1A) TaxID=694429 RepID=G0EH07_PYRF1|nr:GTPase or GTP-binding - cren protein [Pyrolobus fumarii]AEM38457.1 GTPase or GTP-binding - cren protein [Pyrolobus fumarii 1A]